MDKTGRADKVNSALKAFLTDSLAGTLCNFQSLDVEEEKPALDSAEKVDDTKSGTAASQEVGPCSEDSNEAKPRRFTETPTTTPRKRNRWQDGEQSTSPLPDDEENKEVENPLALVVQNTKEAISYLGQYDPENRDTYVDAVDAGGIIDGGTWEHRKRGKEMVNTSQISHIVNELNKRRRHVGSVIPPEALKALVEGSKEKVEEDASGGLKLGSSNKGFQLLQKAGWSSGEGLGPTGEGIKDPIEAKETTVIGERRSPEEDGDQFSEYRKRMMLAYRFRPNPLNNPRRSYDGYATIYDSTSIETVIHGISDENQLNK